MLKLKKLAAILLTVATISTSTVSLNGVQAYAKGKEKGKVTQKQELKTYNSTAALEDTKMGMKFIANAKFIEDPADNQNTIFLSTDGSFINSNLKRFNDYYHAEMNWPSSYECSIEVKDEANSGAKAQIVSSTPTNTIKSSRVSNTMGYSVGGNVTVQAEKPTTVGLNASYNQSQNISYDQENYTTLQNVNTLNKTNWKVQFNSTAEGYERNSNASLYGNQMFMLSRSYNTGTKNLTPDEKLSSLISGGFSPNFLVALKAPKDKKESIVEVTFKRHIDKYAIHWNVTYWSGSNKYVASRIATKKFVINWENHTILPVEESSQS